MNSDTRWKQRFQNFDRALVLLREALERGPGVLSNLEKEGVIQRFEYTFELAWKTIKDFLEEGGLIISPLTPRQVLKDAYVAKVLADGQGWIDMLDHRNLPYIRFRRVREGRGCHRGTLPAGARGSSRIPVVEALK